MDTRIWKLDKGARQRFLAANILAFNVAALAFFLTARLRLGNSTIHPIHTTTNAQHETHEQGR